MSELDNKIHDAMKDQYPWAEDRPLSNKLLDILKKSSEKGQSNAEAYEECMKAAVTHIMPLIETTGISTLFVTAALRIVADLTAKQLDEREKLIAAMLYSGVVADCTVITVNRGEKK